MNWPHLDERIQNIAAGTVETRVAYALADHYVPYSHSEFLISEVNWMVQQNISRRPKCMLIYGDSGCGKSMILNEISRRRASGEGTLDAPVVSVTLPGSSDMRMFFTRILYELDYPFSHRDRKDVLYDQAVSALRAAQTKLLVIDEIHNLLLARKGIEECMVVLRDLINMPLSIIGAGTKASRVCIAADDQLQHRFRCHPLRRWTVTADTRDFIATLESRLPLREPSGLSSKDSLVRLVSKSGGHPATMVTAIRESAREALLLGKECITQDILENVMSRILSEKYEATG